MLERLGLQVATGLSYQATVDYALGELALALEEHLGLEAMLGWAAYTLLTTARTPHEQRRRTMGVIIIREMVGSSPESWSIAAAEAVARAASTVRNIRQVEVVRHTARVDEGRITDYEVELKLFFEYEGT